MDTRESMGFLGFESVCSGNFT